MLFYRVANHETQQGLWYDYKGNFTGLIHDKFNFCTNNKLTMPYDPNIVGWLSAAETLDELFNWFTPNDIKELEKHGYRIAIYEAYEYKRYNNHWVIKQNNSRLVICVSLIKHNGLRLCDGCEALELSVGATCTKPLLYAVLFFLCVGK